MFDEILVYKIIQVNFKNLAKLGRNWEILLFKTSKWSPTNNETQTNRDLIR